LQLSILKDIDNVPFMGQYGKVHMDRIWLKAHIYDPAAQEIRKWPTEVKKDLGSLITKLQKRELVGWPDIASMKTVAQGCFEIRIKDSSGIYRVLYVLESEYGVLVFHCFIKKTKTTPQKEIDTGRRRLRSFLEKLRNEKK